jgi:hypothetical protein
MVGPAYIVVILLLMGTTVQAQGIFEGMFDKAKKSAEQKARDRLNQRIDETIDQGINKTDEAVPRPMKLFNVWPQTRNASNGPRMKESRCRSSMHPVPIP